MVVTGVTRRRLEAVLQNVSTLWQDRNVFMTYEIDYINLLS